MSLETDWSESDSIDLIGVTFWMPGIHFTFIDSLVNTTNVQY